MVRVMAAVTEPTENPMDPLLRKRKCAYTFAHNARQSVDTPSPSLTTP